jgi:uncharacterized protein (DUF885 family)
MKLIYMALAITFVLSSCTKSPVGNGAAPGSEVSAVKPSAVGSVITEAERLNLWFEERFEEQLTQSPMWMTYLGRKDKYDEIDDHSETAEKQQLQWRAATVAELTSEFDFSALSDDAKISYDIWVYQYESNRAMASFRRNRYIFTQILGA